MSGDDSSDAWMDFERTDPIELSPEAWSRLVELCGADELQQAAEKRRAWLEAHPELKTEEDVRRALIEHMNAGLSGREVSR